MKANTKELAVFRGKRTPESLQDWASIFGAGDRQKAERYALAIATFLGTATGEDEWSDYLGQLSPNTRKAYAYSVAEFFEWLATRHAKAVPPHEVTRKDAEDYVHWLANRPFSLAEEKLKDGDRRRELELFEIVKELRNPNIRQIAANLSPAQREEYFNRWPLDPKKEQDYAEYQGGISALSKDVRDLVRLDVVTASPTMEEIRKDHPAAGIKQWVVDGKPLEYLFTYRVKAYSPVSRTTVALRVSALSTFWKTLMRGENVAGGSALLQYNIWDEVKVRVSRGLSDLKKQASKQQKVPSEAVHRMLEQAPIKTLANLRNKAILYLMVFSGLRTTELLKLRRGDTGNKKMPFFDGSEPPAIKVLRKGNKWMRIPYPPVALKVLIEFQARLDSMAASVDAQWKYPDEPHYLHEDSIKYYYRDLQLSDAPLFPALSFWGQNARPKDYRSSMSRIQLYRMLKRVAEDVGLPSELVDKVHPHAIRHFSANAMLAGGKDIREIQQIFGHASVTTTETYLEDVEDEVRLSGQAEVLTYLRAQGVEIEPRTTPDFAPTEPAQPKDYIDTYAVDAEDDEAQVVEAEDVLAEAVQDLAGVSDVLPSHELPEAPEYVAPAEQLVATAQGDILETEGKRTLIGLTADEDVSDAELEKLTEVAFNGKSPGSPDHVYEALETGKALEPVVFNRGGQSDISWLQQRYQKLPKDYGVGRQSLLPWFVKAKGRVTAAGFYKGFAPFPVWSFDQVAPETQKGRWFVEAIEAMHTKFVEGDISQGIAPSPIRSVGLVRWFGFFSYVTHKLDAETSDVFNRDRPEFLSWDALIDADGKSYLREHKDEWLLDWLEKNAHTYRASVDAMKRGVPKGDPRGHERADLQSKDADRDIEKFFLRASFEGVDLLEKMPAWMAENDPVNALFKQSPSTYEEFVAWLANVTGQALSPIREEDRDDAAARVKRDAESLRGLLATFYEEIDRLSEEKVKGATKREDELEMARQNARVTLYGYLLKAAGVSRLDYSMRDMSRDSTTAFTKRMNGYFEQYNVPNPNAEEYRKIPRIKDRIEALVKALYKDTDVLADVNLFADSKLFDPRWFRIDGKKKTIYIEDEAAKELQRQFGITQNPTLLVRRAARAMFEAREKGYDKLWGVMMCYFSWIVPTGVEMEAEARGIPITESGMKSVDMASRQRWLSDYVSSIKELAEGNTLKQAVRDSGGSVVLSETPQAKGDVLGHALVGYDFTLLSSVMDGEDFEDAELQRMFGDDYDSQFVSNGKGGGKRRAGYTKNGQNMYLHVEGERPRTWYKADIFGDRGSMKRNGSDTFVSPAVLHGVQKRLEPVRRLLPSPFRMLSAMNLE